MRYLYFVNTPLEVVRLLWQCGSYAQTTTVRDSPLHCGVTSSLLPAPHAHEFFEFTHYFRPSLSFRCHFMTTPARIYVFLLCENILWRLPNTFYSTPHSATRCLTGTVIIILRYCAESYFFATSLLLQKSDIANIKCNTCAVMTAHLEKSTKRKFTVISALSAALENRGQWWRHTSTTELVPRVVKTAHLENRIPRIQSWLHTRQYM